MSSNYKILYIYVISLDRRDFFSTTCGNIIKLQIKEVNNVIVLVFSGRVMHHSNETFNTFDSRVDRNVFMKPSMISLWKMCFG